MNRFSRCFLGTIKKVYFRSELPELAKGQVLRRVLIGEELARRAEKA